MPSSRETIQCNNEEHIRKEIAMQEELRRLNDTLANMLKRAEERDKKVDEMYEYFVRGGNVVWFIKWIFGTAATVGGLIVLYHSIFHGEN